MSGSQNDRTLASQVPEHDQDPVERRRILNILAQRRYSNSGQPLAGAFDMPGPSENPPSQIGSLAQYMEESFSPSSNTNPLSTLDRHAPPHSSSDIQASYYHRLGIGTTLGDSLLLPAFQQGTRRLSLEPADHGPAAPSFFLGQNSTHTFLPGASPGPSVRGALSLSYNAQLGPAPASPFADYAISMPGLSVICAKVNLFNHIVGPGFSLDIWDPRALSPICLGAPTRPCPANFQPTPLQRSIQHHAIIDVFPWPLFRDRFLYTMSLPKELRPRIAQDDMPIVTLQVMSAAKDIEGGIRVWGSNAFLAENWEVGQTFYSKFWWAIDASIVRSSNQHRARRGEGQLRFEFSDAT
ncbi:hypothetical protein H2200_010542 [Cladophialophora chaetospira]|uniref:Uncharacterized protein n=1 Tax=Cladophialophora chaetospira TaxID=386627 RepID=A0AA39CEF0_9EURO|nr:hypothetical protein H2200_010542 [Cladophialophora chaetospira]